MFNYLTKPTRPHFHGKYKLNVSKVNRLTTCVLRELGVEEYQLSINFVSQNHMRKLNSVYRSKNKSTDVLSFPAYTFRKPLHFSQATSKDPWPKHLGDVVVSLENAKKNCALIGQELDRETAFLITHGVLHLCGFDHEQPTDAKKMFGRQKRIMQKLDWRGCVTIRGEKSK